MPPTIPYHFPKSLPNETATTAVPDGHIVPLGIYKGYVKKTDDVQKMGRLYVWIPEFGGDENDEKNWKLLSYASPFAGATPIGQGVTQMSYGFWMVPPDVGNEVLCCFANGNPKDGYWFACCYQQFMNHMVPGVAINVSTDDAANSKNLPPVMEYDKRAIAGQDYWDPKRPIFQPLHMGLAYQGLYNDPERGPATTSARRQSPSNVFGFSTPRGNNIHIDEDPENEFIRLRTRSGAQILIHETTGYIYMISKMGNSWMEISDEGIDLYSKKQISMRAEGGINLHADTNIKSHGGGVHSYGTYVSGKAEQTIKHHATTTHDVIGPQRVNINSQGGGIAGAMGMAGGLGGIGGALGGLTGAAGALGGLTGAAGALGGLTGATGALGGLTGSLGGLAGAAGALGGLAGGIGGIATGLSGMTGALGGLTGGLTGITGALGGLTGGLAGMTGALGGLTGGLTGITGMMGGLSGIGAGLTGLTGGLTGITGGLAGLASGAGGIAGLVGSVGQIAGGIGALTGSPALTGLAGTLGAVGGITAGITGLATGAAGGIPGFIGSVGQIAGGFGMLTGNQGLMQVSGALGGLTAAAGGIAGLAAGTGSPMAALGQITGGLSLAAGSVGATGLAGAFGAMGGGIAGFNNLAATMGTTLAGAAGQFAGGGIPGLTQSLATLAGGLMGSQPTVAPSLQTQLGQIAALAGGTGIPAFGSSIMAPFASAIGQMGAATSQTLSRLSASGAGGLPAFDAGLALLGAQVPGTQPGYTPLTTGFGAEPRAPSAKRRELKKKKIEAPVEPVVVQPAPITEPTIADVVAKPARTDVVGTYLRNFGASVDPVTMPWRGAYVRARLNELGVDPDANPGDNYSWTTNWLSYGNNVSTSDLRAGDVVIVPGATAGDTDLYVVEDVFEDGSIRCSGADASADNACRSTIGYVTFSPAQLATMLGRRRVVTASTAAPSPAPTAPVSNPVYGINITMGLLTAVEDGAASETIVTGITATGETPLRDASAFGLNFTMNILGAV